MSSMIQKDITYDIGIIGRPYQYYTAKCCGCSKTNSNGCGTEKCPELTNKKKYYDDCIVFFDKEKMRLFIADDLVNGH